MIILSHRGFWQQESEKNTDKAFKNSFSNEFGTETDLRDQNGELLISHDPPIKSVNNIKNFIKIFNEYNPDLTLALNIKSDGLQDLVLKFLKQGNIKNYFVFDMSVPDTLRYFEKGIKVFVRQSEYEKTPSFYERCEGIWLDCFENVWYDEELILNHLKNEKKVAIVSSDLHKRDKSKHWEMLKNWKCINNNNLMLCTDFPVQARKYFKNE
tara:strand:+ start:249 stop:881 length:633 start_codon:yes stop_codon:yes gene_type:complete